MVEMWDDIFMHYDTKIKTAIAQAEVHTAFEKMHQLLDKAWEETFRVLRPGGFACINIGDATRSIDGNFRMYSNHSRILNACHRIGFDILPCIIWRKPTNAPNKFMGSGMLPAGAYVTLEHEHILVLRKNGKRQFDKVEKEARSQSALFWEERNTWFSDLWMNVTGTRQKLYIDSLRKRSAAYPIDIPYRLINMYSQYGDTVLDLFSGTGTSNLAAIMLGRNSIGIDADKKLLAASAKIPSKRSTKGELNELLSKRLQEHMDYVRSKDMLFFRYKNEQTGMPVKTLQEKKMIPYLINSLSRTDQKVSVSYRKWKSEELSKVIYRQVHKEN